MHPTQEQRKAFKQRNKQIKQLTKKYRKAQSAEEKTAVKAELAQIISDTTDANMVWALQRVAAEKENLSVWEQKLRERQKNLEEIKARRVDEILSGEAEHRYKLAKKRWKKEMKEFKKSMK
jgi:phosphoenolpyruvate carboxylase